MTETPGREDFNGKISTAGVKSGALYPGFAGYRANVSRTIPVIALERAA